MRKYRSLLPNRTEMAIFATLAVLCAAVVVQGGDAQGGAHDLIMAALALPIFIAAALLGLRRSPLWAQQPVEIEAEEHRIKDNSNDA